MNKFAYTIEKIDNGFILTGPNPNGEGTMTQVFEETNNEHGEMDALLSVFWEVTNIFCCKPSKHSEDELIMEIKKK